MRKSLRDLTLDLLRMSDSRLLLTAGDGRKKKLRFRIGLIVIVVSYVLWGATFASGALALRSTGSSWWPVASAALILSWVVFATGLLLVGKEVAQMVRLRFLAFFGRKKGLCQTASSVVPSDSEVLKAG